MHCDSRRCQVLFLLLVLSCGFVPVGCSPALRPGRLAFCSVNIGLRGSGTVVGYESGQAFILTAAHVMGGGDKQKDEEMVSFALYDENGWMTDMEVKVAKLIRRDDSLDLAGLRCEIDRKWVHPAVVTDREWPATGEPLVACGFPGGSPMLAIRSGLMAGWKFNAMSRRQAIFSGGVVGGYSGGGIFNAEHRLVGVVKGMGSYQIRKSPTEIVVVSDHHMGVFTPVNRQIVRHFCRMGDER